MAIYFISRFYTGAHEKELFIRKGTKGLEELEEKHKRTYEKNNIFVSLTIIILSAISLVIGYKIGDIKGLWIGVGISILILLISPLKESTIEKSQNEDGASNNK
jgi:hypothetical protein